MTSTNSTSIENGMDLFALYSAVTIRPTTGENATLVHRQRVLDFINRQPNIGTLPCVIGPLGSGKSTLAVQWMQQQGGEFQYISVRPLEAAPAHWIDEPDEFGKAMARLFNECAIRPELQSTSRIEEALVRVVELSRSDGVSFVIDDIEMLTRQGLNSLQPLLTRHFSQFRFKRAMILSRIMDSFVLASLKEVGVVRAVLPAILEFDADEATRAHEIGVFGTASLAEVLTARRSTRGWITGMLATLGTHGGKTISSRRFEGQLLNDMLLEKPKPVFAILIASAYLPAITNSLWQELFRHANLPQWMVATTISQMPVIDLKDRPGFVELVPVLKHALRRLGPVAGDDALINDILTVALKWYVENGHLDLAVRLAKQQNMALLLLNFIRPVIAEHAERENWSTILESLKDLPPDLLLRHDGLTFWYYHGLFQTDRWPELRRLAVQMQSAWGDSSNALTQARLHLVNSWSAYAVCHSDEAYDHAVNAYSLFPPDAHRARMWAAGTASIAGSMGGNWESALHWASAANMEQSFTDQSSRWWHNTAGILQYSWLATRGLTKEAYELSTRQIRLHSDHRKSLATRYLILNAQIQTEWLNLESAESLLEEARLASDGTYSQSHYLRVAQTNIARARGDFDLAWNILSNAPSSPNLRFDQSMREDYLRSIISLEKNDPDAAEMYLGAAPASGNTWIRNFGDVHPELLRARIFQARGDLDRGMTSARAVLTEAIRRNHIHLAVVAQVTLASLLHLGGDQALRNHAINQAQSLSGNTGMQFAYYVNGEDVRGLVNQEDHQESPQQMEVGVRIGKLTDRELEVLSLVAQHQSNKAIAAELFLSVSTVKNHLTNVFDKLGTKDRRTAVRRAQRLGLIRD